MNVEAIAPVTQKNRLRSITRNAPDARWSPDKIAMGTPMARWRGKPQSGGKVSLIPDREKYARTASSKPRTMKKTDNSLWSLVLAPVESGNGGGVVIEGVWQCLSRIPALFKDHIQPFQHLLIVMRLVSKLSPVGNKKEQVGVSLGLP